MQDPTTSTVAHTDLPSAAAAGTALGDEVRVKLGGPPDALIVFASPKYEYAELLRAIDDACRPKLLVGCSSAGEFTSETPRLSSACVVGIRSSEMRFSAGLGRNLRADRAAAATALVSSFAGPSAE